MTSLGIAISIAAVAGVPAYGLPVMACSFLSHSEWGLCVSLVYAAPIAGLWPDASGQRACFGEDASASSVPILGAARCPPIMVYCLTLCVAGHGLCGG